MDKQKIISKVQELLSQSELEQAVDTLQEFLKTEKRYQQLFNYSIQLESELKKTIQDEGLGIISFENAQLSYRQFRNNFVNLLGYVQNDDLNPEVIQDSEPVRIEKKLNQLRILAITGIVLVVGVLVAWRVMKHKQSSDNPNVQVSEKIQDCPTFPPAAADTFNVMIHPFNSLVGAENLNPEITIRTDLQNFCNANNLKSLIKFPNNRDSIRGKLLGDPEIEEFGKSCDAEIVIWGYYEASVVKGIIVTSKFKYIGKRAGFELSQLKWEGENTLDNIKTISSIAKGGTLTQDIKTVISFLAGLIAFEENNPEAAIAKLEESGFRDSKSSDSGDAELLKDMILADAQLQVGNEVAAFASLDKAVNDHPDYWLARNNRGVLLMQQESYLAAAQDFDAALQTTDNERVSVELLIAKGTAYQMAKRPVTARKIFEKAKNLAPENKVIDKKIESADRDIQIERRRFRDAERKIEENPTDEQAWKDKIEASQALEKETAFSQGIQNLKNLRGDRDAYIYIQEIGEAMSRKDTLKVAELVKKAKRNGLDTEILNALQTPKADKTLRAVISN